MILYVERIYWAHYGNKIWTLMRIGKESKEEEHSKMENKMEKVKYIKE